MNEVLNGRRRNLEELIKFAGEHGSLTIEVHGYQHPGVEDQDDANWLSCTLTVKAGPITGGYKSSFTTYDLIRLHDDLKNVLTTLTGVVSFENTESDIEFNIEFNKRGGAAVNGVAHPNRWQGASLRFRLETDQSTLSQTLRQLEAVLRRFPIKQTQ
jgi:hypothetical protein